MALQKGQWLTSPEFTDAYSPRWHRVLFVSRGPKGSMIVPIIEFSQESENVSFAKIIPSGDKKKMPLNICTLKMLIFENSRLSTNVLS